MDSFRLEHPPGNEDWVLSFDFSTLCIFKMDSLRLKYPAGIVAKKRDPGILDPELFSGQIRKVEARLGKLAKIRKVETD